VAFQPDPSEFMENPRSDAAWTLIPLRTCGAEASGQSSGLGDQLLSESDKHLINKFGYRK